MDRPVLSPAASSLVSSDRDVSAQTAELGSSPANFRNDRLLTPFMATGRNGLQAHRAVRSPQALRLPPAIIRLKLAEWLINSESQGKPRWIREPVLVTHTGTLISGFAEWHAAVFAGQAEIDCLEFELNDDEAFQLLITLHRPRPGWNAFTRTELALQQEQYFQSRALTNQAAGGKHKGLANLPKAEHIDVRREIANLAGVCPRNVSKVKIIRKKAHPQLIEALHNGTTKINPALQFCQLPWAQQIEALAHYLGERSAGKTTREYMDKLRVEKLSGDIGTFLTALQRFQTIKPGSVEVRPGTRNKTVILVGKDHWNDLNGNAGAG